MDHPKAPKPILREDGRLHCSHPRCIDASFRTEPGFKLHFATVHTVPYGDGLSVANMESRIVDWCEETQQRQQDAIKSARLRIEQRKDIAVAGEMLGETGEFLIFATCDHILTVVFLQWPQSMGPRER